MQINVQTINGDYTTQEASVRKLEHEMGSIFIIDNLFPEEFIKAFHKNKLSTLPFQSIDYDTDETEHIRHLICELPAKELCSTGYDIKVTPVQGGHMLSILSLVSLEAQKILFPDFKRIFLHRMHVNSVPYGDVLTVHTDCPDEVQCITGLYYANSEWKQEWDGEIIFCDASGEFLYAVEIKPGRLVLFPGNIPHRAGCPNRRFFDRRLTVAMKFIDKPLTAAT